MLSGSRTADPLAPARSPRLSVARYVFAAFARLFRFSRFLFEFPSFFFLSFAVMFRYGCRAVVLSIHHVSYAITNREWAQPILSRSALNIERRNEANEQKQYAGEGGNARGAQRMLIIISQCHPGFTRPVI